MRWIKTAAVLAIVGAARMTMAENQFAQANNRFALDMQQKLAAQDGNIFWSPYSVESAMLMAAEGARNMTANEILMGMGTITAQFQPITKLDDVTRRDMLELAKRINGDASEKRPFELNVANAVWIDSSFPIAPAYKDALKQSFGIDGVFPQPFATDAESARAQINKWVEDKTNKRIENLIPAGTVSALTRMVLTNAVYFKGTWVARFNKDRTQDQPFHAPKGDVKTPLMHQNNESFFYTENDDVQAVKLPYKAAGSGGLSMVVILPRKDDGMATIEKALPAQLENWIAALRIAPVDLYLPRFKITTQFELNSMLQQIGIKEAFTSAADFSGMSDSAREKLCISVVLHKTFVEVNEEGTEAAAATAVVMRATAMVQRPEPKVFRADRPFLFFIRDESTGAILFMGRISDPTK